MITRFRKALLSRKVIEERQGCCKYFDTQHFFLQVLIRVGRDPKNLLRGGRKCKLDTRILSAIEEELMLIKNWLWLLYL